MFKKLCGAKARTNGHRPCRQPAMANGKCRLHGGKSAGPKTIAGKKRVKEVNTKHGFYSIESENQKKLVRDIIHFSRENLPMKE